MGIFLCSCCYENIYKCKGHSIKELNFKRWQESVMDIWLNGTWIIDEHIGLKDISIKTCFSCERRGRYDFSPTEDGYICEDCRTKGW